MKIDDLNIGEAKEIANLFGGNRTSEKLPFGPGYTILIRTVTMIHVGVVARVTINFIELKDAGWVADAGRFGECLANGKLCEFERAPDWVLINRGAIVDVYPWPHPVPQQSI